MANNAVSICNMALGELGINAITSLDQATADARLCNRFYEQTRDEVLRAHPWNFAIKRVNLSAISTAPVFGWLYQYQLPSDYLRLIQLNGWEEDEQADRWEIEADKLLTDETTV